MHKDDSTPRVTGIGGIFFKSDDPDGTKSWYQAHLGLQTDQWGTNFAWHQGADPTQKGFTQWSPFTGKSEFFADIDADFVINYRVVHLERLVAQLAQEGVTILDQIVTFDYGKFVHILDNEGRKVQLWEPNDEAYDKLVDGRTM